MEMSRRAMQLLREASRSPLVLQNREPGQAVASGFLVVRKDGLGFTHQIRTLQALLKVGLVQETTKTIYSISPIGQSALKGLA